MKVKSVAFDAKRHPQKDNLHVRTDCELRVSVCQDVLGFFFGGGGGGTAALCGGSSSQEVRVRVRVCIGESDLCGVR